MSQAAAQLAARKDQLEADLLKTEKMVYTMETDYLQADYTQCGTVLKGFEGFLSSKDALRKRARAFKPEDRAFSLSSKSSAATQELADFAMDQLEAMGVPGLGKGKTIQPMGTAQKGRRGG
ncbi:probable chromatin modification-related protein MEAF6 [Coccomyxa sp. Obi]|nr:probable chromatin modification-related protein MEAF6 [Coccomyxa sp. Obi]